MNEVFIDTEYIKLDQLLKYANFVSSGGEAKFIIKEGLVKVNGIIVEERGKKIKNNDIVEVNQEKVKIISNR